MTPSATQCFPAQFNLGTLKGRNVIANFEGGRITSDAGIVLMAELDKKLGLTARFAKCFRDHQNLSYVDYSAHESDTPSEAGGLMSVTASKAGDLARSISAIG